MDFGIVSEKGNTTTISSIACQHGSPPRIRRKRRRTCDDEDGQRDDASPGSKILILSHLEAHADGAGVGMRNAECGQAAVHHELGYRP